MDNVPTVSIFKNRTFLIVWAGQTVSVLGDILFNLALMWWVVNATGSGTAMSASALATALPRIFLGPLAGVVADRFDRRKLMIGTNMVNCLITAIMAVLYINGIFSLPLIILAAALIGTVTTVHTPTFDATVPSIVSKDELIRVNSLMQSSRSLAGIAAPALSGLVLALFGVGASIAINSLTFLVAAASLMLVTLPSPKVGARLGVWKDSMQGFRFIGQHKLLLPMMLFFVVINLSLSPIGVAIPVLIVKVLAAGPALFGMFGSSQSVGILLGSLLLSTFPRLARREGLVLVLAIIGVGCSVLIMGMAQSAMPLLLGAFVMGLTIVLAQISSQSIWQRETPDEVRGRAFAARHTFSAALQPLGMAAAGPLVDLIGPSKLLAGAGIFCALSGTLGFIVPGLTRYVSKKVVEPVEPAASV